MREFYDLQNVGWASDPSYIGKRTQVSCPNHGVMSEKMSENVKMILLAVLREHMGPREDRIAIYECPVCLKRWLVTGRGTED